MKEPGRSKLIEWHRDHGMANFNFREEIHEYGKADVNLSKSG